MRNRFLWVLALMTLTAPCILGGVAWASDFPIISTQELKAKLEAGTKMVLVNPLSDIEFKLVHIPGSINVPLGEIKTTDKLPQDKDVLIVTY